MNEVTRILAELESGDPNAANDLLPLVYDELRKLAAARLSREDPGQTLQSTALVHEAYVRLVHGETAPTWADRKHFFAAAARAMRNILVDNARRKGRLKRGGEYERCPLDQVELFDSLVPVEDLLALEEALTKLEQEDPEQSQVVQLRFFAGLSHEETARILGISVSTAKRQWRYARAWLRQQMIGDQSADS